MKIWLPNALYQSFPLLCVLAGFGIVMFWKNPFAIITALLLYIYSYSVLWLRSSSD